MSAAIMSAPAALAMAKLSFPETEQSQTKTEQDVYMEKTYVTFYQCSGVHTTSQDQKEREYQVT